MKKRMLSLFLMMIFCLTLLSVPAQAAARAVYVVSNTLPVYRSPSTGARVLGTMAFGEVMRCTAISGNWARVYNSSGAMGYCLKSGISVINPNTLNKKIYIKANSVAVHRYPSSSSRVMMRLKLNASFTWVGTTRDGKWARLKNGSHYGFVPVQYISLNRTPTQPAPTKESRIAALARAQLGKGYAYGAEGGSRFDCSGLSYYVYKNAAGVTLRRSSYDQAYDGRYKKISSLSKLEPGDLLFFDTGSGKVDHVGVYVGDGQFVHASASAGKVLTGSISSGYYRSAFLWARRIL